MTSGLKTRRAINRRATADVEPRMTVAARPLAFMPSTPDRRRLLRLALVAVTTSVAGGGLPPWPRPAHAATFDLATLMTRLANTKEGRARFTEERHVNGFDAPLRTSGELYFKAPDVFERRTLKPSAEAMLVTGTRMTLERGNQKRTLSLDAAPEAAAIVAAIRGTLTGDAKALDEHFRVNLGGSDAAWLLDLQPRSEQLAANVRNVQLRGGGAEVRGVEIWFASGDRSAMTIVPMK